jgi:multicomponent Na+:H+ antiporter subunit C
VELLLAIVSGVLYATGLYLMLRRRLAQVIIGLALLSHGSNILIFTAAGLTRSSPPLIPETGTAVGHLFRGAVPFARGATPFARGAVPFADPVPQSLILTAIVIGFGVLAFALVLAHRVHVSAATEDIDRIVPDRA